MNTARVTEPVRETTELEGLSYYAKENKERLSNVLTRVESLVAKLQGDRRDNDKENCENRKAPDGLVEEIKSTLVSQSELLGAIQHNLGILENII